jgi:hypothetical protein
MGPAHVIPRKFETIGLGVLEMPNPVVVSLPIKDVVGASFNACELSLGHKSVFLAWRI